MANVNSNADSNIFQNIECSFSELFELLPKSKIGINTADTHYTPDSKLLKAIHRHAENSTYKLQTGIQSLGILLANIKDDPNMGISVRDISSVGWLIQLLSDLLMACYLTETNIKNELARRGVIL